MAPAATAAVQVASRDLTEENAILVVNLSLYKVDVSQTPQMRLERMLDFYGDKVLLGEGSNATCHLWTLKASSATLSAGLPKHVVVKEPKAGRIIPDHEVEIMTRLTALGTSYFARLYGTVYWERS